MSHCVNVLSPDSNNWPSTGKVNLVPTEQLLVIGVADSCVHVVVVQDRTKTRIGKDTPK